MKALRSTIAIARVNRCVIRLIVATSCVGGSLHGIGVAQQLPSSPSVGITFKTESPDVSKSGTLAPVLPATSFPGTAMFAKDASALLPIPTADSDRIGVVALTAASESSRKTSSHAAEGKTQVRFIGDSEDVNEPAKMPSLPLPSQPSAASQSASKSQSGGALKFTLGDDGVVDHGVQKTHNAPQLTQRSPELVKPSRQAPTRVVAVASSKDPSLVSPAPIAPSPRNGSLVAETGEVVVPQEIDLNVVPAPAIPGSGLTLGNSRPVPPIAPAPATPIVSNEARHSEGVRAASASDVERVVDLEILDTYTVDVPFTVISATAKNADACNVFFNGKTVTIVGRKPGKTVVEIRSANNERRLVSFRIVPTGQRQAGPKSDVDKVMEMVAEHFPTANIRFSQSETGSILLRGTVSSEADARKILELVRKVCLVPVEDKVQVIR